LVAANKPQMKKRAKRDWSKAKARTFLEALADTCNVSEACRRTGVPMTVAYRRRKMDASFRAEWAEMIAVGYQRLEAMLLKRAFDGTEKVIRRRDGSEERVREYPDHIALKLLQMHRETALEADSEPPVEDVDEIRKRIVQKLQRMKKRDEEEDARNPPRSDVSRDADSQGSDGGAATSGP
jgi:hypothetical protein